MENKLASNLSIVFHPLWFPFGMLILYLLGNPIAFRLSEPFQDKVLILQTLITCIILPLVAILVMWKAKLVSSLYMDNRVERAGPYIAVMVFLIWYYLNIKQYGVAPVYRLYILGGIISLMITFVLNLFVKVSMHAVGIAGLLINLVIAKQLFSYSTLLIEVGGEYYAVSFQIILIVVLLILFIVLLSRFYLKKHNRTELLGGLILGFAGQILAIRLMDII